MASGIFLTNKIPIGVRLQSITLSQGTLATNGENIVAWIGSLATNATATLNLILSPTAQALGYATNDAQVIATNLPDPILFNNHTAQTYLVRRQRS